MNYTCGACGDNYVFPPEHECWLVAKMGKQEQLEPLRGTAEIIGLCEGSEAEDGKVPDRMKRVDLGIT